MLPNTLLAGSTRQHLKSASSDRSPLAPYFLGHTFYFLEDNGTNGIFKSLPASLTRIQVLKDLRVLAVISPVKIIVLLGEKNTTYFN